MHREPPRLCPGPFPRVPTRPQEPEAPWSRVSLRGELRSEFWGEDGSPWSWSCREATAGSGHLGPLARTWGPPPGCSRPPPSPQGKAASSRALLSKPRAADAGRRPSEEPRPLRRPCRAQGTGTSELQHVSFTVSCSWPPAWMPQREWPPRGGGEEGEHWPRCQPWNSEWGQPSAPGHGSPLVVSAAESRGTRARHSIGPQYPGL